LDTFGGRVHDGVSLSNGRATACAEVTNDGVFRAALGARRISLSPSLPGTVSFSVRIDASGGVVRVGVAKPNVDLEDGWRTKQAWGFFGFNGKIYFAGKRRDYGPMYKGGDVITVTLDRETRSMRYTLNGKDLGVAFSKLPMTVVPFIEFGNRADTVSFIEQGEVEVAEEEDEA
ncbi:hypothetical protein KIPB_000001, partial [Kipferlia bialata]